MYLLFIVHIYSIYLCLCKCVTFCV